jgi:hypothetical protein
VSSPADGKPTSRFPSALGIALYKIIAYKVRSPRGHIKDHSSSHGDPAFGAVGRANAKRGAVSVLVAGMQQETKGDKARSRSAGSDIADMAH